MSSFHHKEGWSVTGNAEAISRLGVLITRLDLFERTLGEHLNYIIAEELESRDGLEK
jgi:hypothetical protein